MPIRHHYKPATMHAILSSPHGGLAQDMFKRAIAVQKQAKLNLQRPPSRVNTGQLRASITIVPFFFRTYPAFKVGSPLKHARWVHDGTGIYGPHHQPIVPTHAKSLAWEGPGGMIFAKSVKGMRANPFLKDALSAARI